MRAGPVWLCLAVAQPSAADSVVSASAFGVTNTLTVEARADNGNDLITDDDYGVVVDRLHLQYSGQFAASALGLSVRLDAVGFSGAHPRARFESDVRPERVSAHYSEGAFELTIGDFPRQLGRGIVFSVRKVDEVGLDLSIAGAELRWSPAGHSLSIFGGALNPANLDVVSQRPLSDPGDLVAGASYALDAIDGAIFGAHALFLQPHERLLSESIDYTLSGGLSAELPAILEGLALYLEADLQSRRLAGSSELGAAAYLTADVSIGDLSLLLEGIWLEDFEQRGSKNDALGARFELNAPPTLERVDQEVASTRDVKGVRARVELSFLEGALAVYVNGVVRHAAELELLQLHGYAGVERRFDELRSKLALSAGIREESQPLVGRVKGVISGELDLLKSIDERWAIHASGNVELRESPSARPGERWLRGSSFLGAERGGLGALTVELGYDTENPTERQLFFAALLSAELSDALSLRATAGTQRGGLKCANGVCRDFPEFAGGRVELVVRL